MLILSLPPYCSPPLSYHAPFNHFISPSLPLLSFTFLLCILLILIPIVFCPLYFSPFCPSFLFSFIFYYLSFISKGFVDCVPNISFLSSDFSFSSSLHILSMSYKSWNNFLSSPSSKKCILLPNFCFYLQLVSVFLVFLSLSLFLYSPLHSSVFFVHFISPVQSRFIPSCPQYIALSLPTLHLSH